MLRGSLKALTMFALIEWYLLLLHAIMQFSIVTLKLTWRVHTAGQQSLIYNMVKMNLAVALTCSIISDRHTLTIVLGLTVVSLWFDNSALSDHSWLALGRSRPPYLSSITLQVHTHICFSPLSLSLCLLEKIFLPEESSVLTWTDSCSL